MDHPIFRERKSNRFERVIKFSCFAGKCSLSDPRVLNASVLMLKLGEHTWGQAGNCVDNIHWTNAQFDKMLKDPGKFNSFLQ